ncbi:hypothetical protein OIU74_021432 [Salix koriyanagi]|uniref:Uncharacterized protein n=1 Tax=Salix koriyanagi TaxID=2511006 RepID=A0A9Q0WKZ0_9ROSI|nr:hypothetical protein OIU74_021432 [Salix koriyanagi]
MQFWNTGWVRKEYEVVDLMKREGLGRNGGDDGGGNSFANHLAWKQVWPMNVHGKIKVFIWALHNSIQENTESTHLPSIVSRNLPSLPRAILGDGYSSHDPSSRDAALVSALGLRRSICQASLSSEW